MVLALLGGVLLVGMIGYVFNNGRHAQLRQQTQSAADATVISGAGYVARSFNTVAMNNVEISRLIAVVQLLDAVPLATEYTLKDVRATLERVQDQIGSGTGDPQGDRVLNEIAEDLRDQERRLHDMDRFFNGGRYDVREMTFYDSDFGRGKLWAAMEALDEISLATMETLGELTQVTGIDTGLRNMQGGGGETLAAVAPFDRRIEWKRYVFDDFRLPVVMGRLPQWVDHPVTNRGPYDTIFGWRIPDRQKNNYPNPEYRPGAQSQPPGSPWSDLVDDEDPSTIDAGSTLTGYTTYGPWRGIGEILRQQVDTPGVLHNSSFVTRVVRMGGAKLNKLWPRSVKHWEFVDPEWIMDFDRAQRIIKAGTPKVAYTQFIEMVYQQRFLNDRPLGPEALIDWDIDRPRGGWDHVPGATKTRDHVWEDSSIKEWQIVRVDAKGNEVVDTHRVETRWSYVWAGINVGKEVTIRNPNNFGSREGLPAPLDFDHKAMQRPVDGALGYPGSPFTFLGLAKQPNAAPLWGQLFSESAYEGHVGIAQASIFNNHSWDMWTQMWHAQLEPVQDYRQWVSLLEQQVDHAAGYEDLSVGELEELTNYLKSLEKLAPIMLTH